MVKRPNGRRRKPQSKKISRGNNIDGIRRPRRGEAYKRQKINNGKHIYVNYDYIEQEINL